MSISRRATLAWVAGAVAVGALASPWLLDHANTPADPHAPPNWPKLDLPPVTARGYGSDPNLVEPSVPWPLTMTPAQRAQAKFLAGIILPADDHSPSAADLPIDAFIDEWISAPYPQQQEDRTLILEGLAWLDIESKARFGGDFAHATPAQRAALFDDIAWQGRIKPGLEKPAHFFDRLRSLVMGGYYSLPEGMKDIGYLGNAPATQWPGPPDEAIAQLNAALSGLGLPPQKT
ncbi:MAG: gluconate 2-dehydrogenase subunit 3 family protein [Alphaproteobacteria bacterium]|nr:gluconate 2-dehydrogenase subunit 3 family protein [Alphaproteobacteria bacterium]